MTTYTDFVPTRQVPFSFQPTLDGQVCTARVTWSLFGVRYYLNLYAQDGTRLITTALVGSPSGIALQTLSWSRGFALAVAPAPHGYKVGRTVELTISGAVPDAYNGIVPAFITGPATFRYPVATDPGTATVPGSAAYNINLVGALFDSTLVFREAAQQFEVSP